MILGLDEEEKCTYTSNYESFQFCHVQCNILCYLLLFDVKLTRKLQTTNNRWVYCMSYEKDMQITLNMP